MLRHIRPHLWLGPLLNHGVGAIRVRQVWYREFSMRLWEWQCRFPTELLQFREGHTQPDVVIECENPPTTVTSTRRAVSTYYDFNAFSGMQDLQPDGSRSVSTG